MSITGTFTFHNVGQGLFYSGILDKGQEGKHEFFSFVYDCGTESEQKLLHQEIDNCVKFLSSIRGEKVPVLDLLIVSHLHGDHVSGLERLLGKVKVRAVVMPYVYAELLQALKLDSIHGHENFFESLYNDPIEWLSGKGAEIIFLIGSDNDLADDQNDKSRSNLDENKPLINGVHINPRPLLVPNQSHRRVYKLENDAKMEIKNFSWCFCFGYLPRNQSELISYLKNIEEKFNVSLDDGWKKKDLINLRKDGSKNIFRGGNKAVNRTSVVVSHHSVENKGTTKFKRINYDDAFNKKLIELLSPIPCCCETLLAGDIELDPEKPMPIIDRLLGANTLVLQYPHHGGKNDIDRFVKLYAKFNVVSFGFGNVHRHPSDEIVRLPNYLELVHQRNAFEYTITVSSEDDDTVNQNKGTSPQDANGGDVQLEDEKQVNVIGERELTEAPINAKRHHKIQEQVL